jgi:hypothetical protein
MEFIEKIHSWQSHAKEQIELIKMDCQHKEEDTKTALVQPFINTVLGYNTANLKEVKTEFNIDGGSLRIDYAILRDGVPIILIECKKYTDNLDKRYITQLKTYYPNIRGSESKFAILTNGVHYNFYTDIQNKNILDDEPFMELNLLNDISESAINELKEFAKSGDIDIARSNAEVIKKRSDIKKIIYNIFECSPENPDNFARLKDFAYFIAKQAQVPFVGDRVVKEYAQLTKDAVDEYISESIKRKLETAISSDLKNNIKNDEQEIPSKEKSFLFEDKIFKIEQWHEMLTEVCAIIADKNKIEFERILEIRGSKYNYYSKDPNEFKNGIMIKGTDIYVNPCEGKWDNLHRSRRVIAKFGLPKDIIQLRD